MNRKHINSMIGGKALRTVLTVAAVLLTGSTAMGQGPTIGGSVYGGGALANTGNTTVNLTGGTVTVDVYGGGMGDASYHMASFDYAYNCIAVMEWLFQQ